MSDDAEVMAILAMIAFGLSLAAVALVGIQDDGPSLVMLALALVVPGSGLLAAIAARRQRSAPRFPPSEEPQPSIDVA